MPEIQNGKIICFKGADKICGYVDEDPKQITYLVEQENLPAWKRQINGTWRALNVDLDKWMLFQRSKYIQNTPKYIKDGK